MRFQTYYSPYYGLSIKVYECINQLGFFSMELWGDEYWTPHYTLFPPYRGKGIGSLVLDYMRKHPIRKDRMLVWSRESLYKGYGTITKSGQAFAEAYTKHRNLRTPDWGYFIPLC